MNQRILMLRLFAVLILCLVPPASAHAGVPSPTHSSVPSCLTTCPIGDRSFVITVRDITNAPVVGATVAVSLADCVGVFVALCNDCAQQANYNAVTREFRRTTDANGLATFQLCATVLCPGRTTVARVLADGVMLTNARFANADFGGDLNVEQLDVWAVSTQIGHEYMPGYDQNCDGALSQADVDIVQAHVGHACIGALPVAPTSWGTMKAIYR